MNGGREIDAAIAERLQPYWKSVVDPGAKTEKDSIYLACDGGTCDLPAYWTAPTWETSGQILDAMAPQGYQTSIVVLGADGTWFVRFWDALNGPGVQQQHSGPVAIVRAAVLAWGIETGQEAAVAP